MEGVTNEAASLAGHLGLGKLIVYYDDNKISIDGHTELSFTEDVNARYEALGWHVQHVEDGNHDIEGIRKATEAAIKETSKPSFIKVLPSCRRLPRVQHSQPQSCMTLSVSPAHTASAAETSQHHCA